MHDNTDCLTSSTASDRAVECCSVDSEQKEVFDAEEISAEARLVRNAAFRLLLDEGNPLPLDRLTSATGLDHADVARALEQFDRDGRVRLDPDGSVVGIAGLDIRSTGHRLEFAGKDRWTWCALDAVGILGALGATAVIHSSAPSSEEDVTIPFEAGSPAHQGVSIFIADGFGGGKVIDEWCPLVNFFPTRAAGEAWAAERGLGGRVVTVAEITPAAAQRWAPVVAGVSS